MTEHQDRQFWINLAISLLGRDVMLQGKPYRVLELLDHDPVSLVLECCVKAAGHIQSDQYGRARRSAAHIATLQLFEADGQSPSAEWLAIASQVLED